MIQTIKSVFTLRSTSSSSILRQRESSREVVSGPVSPNEDVTNQTHREFYELTSPVEISQS